MKEMMGHLHSATPLIESLELGVICGARVWLKMDALQPTGSFKIRGIGYACSEYVKRGAEKLVCSSGGNAGLAVAYAGRRLEVPVVVVVPTTTTERAKTLIRLEGAKVVVHGSSWNEAHQYALGISSKASAYLHPFDDPLIWQGHATLIDEVAQSGLRPDAVVVAVGGGGLLCGVLEGLHRNAMASIPVVAVETLGADSFCRAKAAGCLVELEAITSIATSLGAKQVCSEALAWAGRHTVACVVVPDATAVDACYRFLNDHRVLVEPACGAALSTVYDPPGYLADCKDILVIVCGGVGVSMEQLEEWRASSG